MIDVPVEESGSDYSDYGPVYRIGLTKWTSWSQSSASCGAATLSRNRACGSEPPYDTKLYENSRCSNDSKVFVDRKWIYVGPCCEWASWGPWSSLSVTCGGGIITKKRKCSGPTGNIIRL